MASNNKQLPDRLALARLFGDGMVLQRDEYVCVWGFARPGEAVSVCLRGARCVSVADESGRWQAELPPMGAGGPFQLEVSGGGAVILREVWIGDVWLCSGQSNMAMLMCRVRELHEEDIALSYNLGIRFFTVPDRTAFGAPCADYDGGQWDFANPENVLHFGATAYFFARALFERYHVPIGIINASVGGAPVEAWMSRASLAPFGHITESADCFLDAAYRDRVVEEANQRVAAWQRALDEADEGLKGQPNWFSGEYDDAGWERMHLPGRWADAQPGEIHGALWFRRSFTIPKRLAGKRAQLLLGRIIDSDQVYLNDILVGSTSYQYPPRKYAIPGNVLKAGENIICVRVVNSAGRGGFAEGKPYKILIDREEAADLTGEWRYRIGAAAPEAPVPVWLSRQPSSLYNGMLAPAVGYGIKGFAWYQGESNTGDTQDYGALFTAMIRDWRRVWGRELPFLFVQLPNFLEEYAANKPGWPRIREAQRKALALARTGMAVALDVGEWYDLHPLGKRPVGERLALLARGIAYGEELICAGPLFRSAQRRGGRAVISFEPGCGSLSTSDSLSPQGFEAAGEDGVFAPARAEIEGDCVLVWREGIVPKTVRYAWADNPERCNLCGETGLPASPFEAAVE